MVSVVAHIVWFLGKALVAVGLLSSIGGLGDGLGDILGGIL